MSKVGNTGSASSTAAANQTQPPATTQTQTPGTTNNDNRVSQTNNQPNPTATNQTNNDNNQQNAILESINQSLRAIVEILRERSQSNNGVAGGGAAAPVGGAAPGGGGMSALPAFPANFSQDPLSSIWNGLGSQVPMMTDDLLENLLGQSPLGALGGLGGFGSLFGRNPLANFRDSLLRLPKGDFNRLQRAFMNFARAVGNTKDPFVSQALGSFLRPLANAFMNANAIRNGANLPNFGFSQAPGILAGGNVGGAQQARPASTVIVIKSSPNNGTTPAQAATQPAAQTGPTAPGTTQPPQTDRG